ncbi:MAG TPA: glycosyltransferase family 1 protein [Terriglobia bacterium]|nr:glycosyltransferase family 1 protein [Terriglobia bacterium]
MATIALDATYSVDPQLTGIGVYSRRLIETLLTLETPHRFLISYRLSRLGRRQYFLRPGSIPGARARFSVRVYQEPLTFWLPWQAQLFHSLAQRPPAFHFRREIVTVFDIFPITGENYSTADFRQKFSALLLQAVGRATRVITSSHATESLLISHARVPPEKIRVIPLGVDPPAVILSPSERLRERARILGGEGEMMLSVGVIQIRKNTLNMLKALKTLPAKYRLVLSGGNGYGSEAIHEFIRTESLGDRVKLLGYIDDGQLARLYQAASVFLFPSLEEGFGIPVLEAMANGVPVVTSNVSSMPEVGGEAALYVDPRDPADIAQKVVQAVEDSALRAGLVQKGLARASEFTWRRTAQATLAVYDEIL